MIIKYLIFVVVLSIMIPSAFAVHTNFNPHSDFDSNIHYFAPTITYDGDRSDTKLSCNPTTPIPLGYNVRIIIITSGGTDYLLIKNLEEVNIPLVYFGSTINFSCSYIAQTLMPYIEQFELEFNYNTPYDFRAKTNIHASYNQSTKGINVSWDFNLLPSGSKCAIRSDMFFDEGSNDEDTFTYHPNFIPSFFSTISSTPTFVIQTSADPTRWPEEIDCSGSFKIDIDTIMSHFLNIEKYRDFENHITFYALDSDGTMDGSVVMDNIMIDYTISHYADEAVHFRICDSIGYPRSMLWIDVTQNTIHGQDTNDCFKYLSLQSTEWVDVNSDKSITRGFHSTDFLPLIEVDHPSLSVEQTKKKGNGGCADCTPPTLGLDKTYKRVVDDGFSYNGNMVQVEKWYTDFPLINATVGIPNLVEIKVYENTGINNMKWVQFCLGAEERGQPLNSCEVLIEVHLSTNGTTTDIAVKEIVINDKDNLIDNDTVAAISYVVPCMENSTLSNCVKVDLDYTYREETLNHMLIVNVVDKTRNSQNFHFNEGVNVLGKSINEPLTITLFEKHASQQKDNLWITYTRTDKITDTWTDQNGIEYHRINDATFDRITPVDSYECKDPPLDEINVPTRNNCNFRALTNLWD